MTTIAKHRPETRVRADQLKPGVSVVLPGKPLVFVTDAATFHETRPIVGHLPRWVRVMLRLSRTRPRARIRLSDTTVKEVSAGHRFRAARAT